MTKEEKTIAILAKDGVNAFEDHNKVWVDVNETITVSIHPDEIEYHAKRYDNQ